MWKYFNKPATPKRTVLLSHLVGHDAIIFPLVTLVPLSVWFRWILVKSKLCNVLPMRF